MNEVEFESIKTKIKNKEIEDAQAKGKMESIEEVWKSKYGCQSLEQAEEKLSELKKENEEKSKKRDAYFEKLKNLTNWEEF